MRAARRVGGIGCLGLVVENRSGGPRYLRPLLLTFTLVVDIGALPAALVRRHGTPTGVGVAAAGKRFGAHLSFLPRDLFASAALVAGGQVDVALCRAMGIDGLRAPFDPTFRAVNWAAARLI